MTSVHDAAVVGIGYAGDCAAVTLHARGVTDVVAVEDARSLFDAATDTWLLRTPAGAEYRATIIIAAHGLFHVPVTPNIAGRNDFAGPVFHATTWDRGFDPVGKRVALVGAAAPPVARRLSAAARLIVFHCRNGIPGTGRTLIDRIARRASIPRIESVTADVERITPTGIRTVDGAEHAVDAVIYATGDAIPDGLTDETVVGRGGLPLRKAWQEGAQAYLGIAVHGFPNFFLLDGPGCTDDIDAQMRHVMECVEHMRATGSSRVEVRLSSQRLYAQHGVTESVTSAFEFSIADDEDVYDGPATLVRGDQRCRVRVRLTGYLDPIDGKYHWRGTVFDQPALTSGPVRLDIDDRTAPARITEVTPWGSFTIAGVGMPPFPLDVVQPT